ncbi:MICOS complex subunit mic25a-like isoform X1 [Gadus chalcogrammus]|uniref:MICOS complex subunit mic25a-like isoform X1 n=1 Tax=Gadus chalcogrammus TaxID=1042646 RepID=UPI0024C3DAB6|nr:MICOS complex subunit mic25a-like isoform X1 [Gadus chalcogrammus]
MGSAESSTRRVSFGVDEEERVRILRGVKLTEDVLQRMRGVANMAPSPPSTPTASSQPDPANKSKEPGPSSRPSPKPAPRPQPAPQPPAQPASRPTSPKTSRTASPKPTPNANANASASAAEEKKRYERQQQIMAEELAKVAKKEREAAREEMSAVLRGERLMALQESEKAQQLPPAELQLLAKRLQKKDADLKVMDAFYKEQLDLLEKRNIERFRQSSEQFNQAATSCEANVRPRGTTAVCSGLQAQILHCYRDNRQEPLLCSELAKQYQQCISTAKTNLMVNHG